MKTRSGSFTSSMASMAIASLIAGCAVAFAPAAVGPEPKAAIAIVPAFKAAPLRVQAVVEPYTGGHVEHLVLKLFTVSGSTETQVKGANDVPLEQDLQKGGFDGPLLFNKLHMDSTYRVRGYAYKASGTADADKISVDTGSFVDITVTKDDRPEVATLSIQLKAKDFDGQGTGSIEFKPGVVNDDEGGEKVE